MRINQHMDLSQLRERMGSPATVEEARAMRDMLVDQFDGMDTEDIEQDRWNSMLEQSVELTMTKDSLSISQQLLETKSFRKWYEGMPAFDGSEPPRAAALAAWLERASLKTDRGNEVEELAYQLIRYGHEPMSPLLVDMLRVLTDINDDMAHGRDLSFMRDNVRKIKTLADELLRQEDK